MKSAACDHNFDLFAMLCDNSQQQHSKQFQLSRQFWQRISKAKKGAPGGRRNAPRWLNVWRHKGCSLPDIKWMWQVHCHAFHQFNFCLSDTNHKVIGFPPITWFGPIRFSIKMQIFPDPYAALCGVVLWPVQPRRRHGGGDGGDGRVGPLQLGDLPPLLGQRDHPKVYKGQ